MSRLSNIGSFNKDRDKDLDLASTKKALKFFPFYLIASIPFGLMYFCSRCTYFILFYLIKYRRKVVRNNLERSFPTKSSEEIRRIEKDFYKHLCNVVYESLKRLRLKKAEMKKRFVITNPEMLKGFYTQGRNIIVFGAHYGNWEWVTGTNNYTEYAGSAFYRKLSSRYFDELTKISRSHTGGELLEVESGFKTLLSWQKDGKLFLNYIIGDQSPSSNYKWFDFLNQKTAFSVGMEKIAHKLDCVVLYPNVTLREPGHYEITYVCLSENPKNETLGSVTQKYVEQLHTSINTRPELWLWSHKRWKHQFPS